MPVPSLPTPVRMRRIALLAPRWATRQAIAVLGRTGNVELAGDLPAAEGLALEALRRVERSRSRSHSLPRIADSEPDLGQLETDGEVDLLAGEVELDRYRRLAVQHGDVSVFLGWTPQDAVDDLRSALAPVATAVVEMDSPATEEPPTQLAEAKATNAFRPILNTYGVLPYSDVDPTAFAAVAFVIMFGMMFGDIGHGALLVVAGLGAMRSRHSRLTRLAPAGPLLVAAGVSGAFFGLLYGEFFGPTGVITPLWLSPLDEPLELLATALVLGASLLAVSHLLGTINRWREGGLAAALYSQGGLAGALLFAAVAGATAGILSDIPAILIASLGLAFLAIALLFVGAEAEAGGGGMGITMGLVKVFDGVVRLGSNVVSFTRLAAFGMTHAALSLVVWNGTTALATSPPGWFAAASLFVVGTAAAIALEGLVAGIQALRLEYYELFSRMLGDEGRPFQPFALTTDDSSVVFPNKEAT